MLFDTVNILIFHETCCTYLLMNRQIFLGADLFCLAFNLIGAKIGLSVHFLYKVIKSNLFGL